MAKAKQDGDEAVAAGREALLQLLAEDPEVREAVGNAALASLREVLLAALSKGLETRLAEYAKTEELKALVAAALPNLKEYVKVFDLKIDAFRRPIPGVHIT